MGDDDIHLPYRLALSVVRVTGIVEVADDPSTGTPTRSPTGDMTLGVEADPVDLGHAILMRGGGWDERKLDVKLTHDGRLSSSAMELSGAGGAMIAAGAKLLSFGIGLGIAALGVLSAEESDQEQAYRTAHPDLAARRKELREGINALHQLMGQLANEAASAEAPERGVPLRQLPSVRLALDAVRTEANLLETHFDAWVAATYVARQERYEFVVGTDALPTLNNATEAPPFVDLDDAALSGPMAKIARALGVVVLAAEGEDQSELGGAPDPGEAGIVYRIPRPLTLAVYEATESAQAGEETGDVEASQDQGAANRRARRFVLRSVQRAWVVDRCCQVATIGLKSGLFEKASATVEFADTGTLAHVGTSSSSVAGTVAAALGALPENVKEGLSSASAVVGEVGKLRVAQADAYLAELERKKKIAEATIASKPSAMDAQLAQLQRIKAQADTAAALKALGGDLTLLRQAQFSDELDAELTMLLERAKAARAADRAG